MQEYRIRPMPSELKRKLASKGIELIEEKFKGRKNWLVYSKVSLKKLLDSYEVEYSYQEVADTGWETHWMDYLSDGWLTDNYYYVFEDKSFDDDRGLIRINPALAFGTGGHATTQLAAKLLEQVAKNKLVLDIGTGSGILSILASFCGAKTIYSFDIDPVAIKNAAENVDLNHCSNIFLWAGSVSSVNHHVRAGLVVANIISSELIKLHPHVLSLRPKYIVYSGILKKEASDFMASINLHGYKVDSLIQEDEWCALRLKSTE